MAIERGDACWQAMVEQRQHPQEVARRKKELQRRNMKAGGCKLDRLVEVQYRTTKQHGSSVNQGKAEYQQRR